MSNSNYAAAADDALAEIIREAEARLSAQLTVALAADQRAMTFAGLMVATAGAMIGAALGASPHGAFTVPVFVTAVGLFISAIMGVVAARPVAWDYVGNTPQSWLSSIASGKKLHDDLAEMAEHYGQMIGENETSIADAAFWLRLSMCSALFSLLVGLVAAAIRVF